MEFFKKLIMNIVAQRSSLMNPLTVNKDNTVRNIVNTKEYITLKKCGLFMHKF